MVVLQAFSDELTRDGEGEHLIAECDRADVGEPHQERGLRELGPSAIEHGRPGPSRFLIRQCDCHLRFHRTFPHRWITHIRGGRRGRRIAGGPITPGKCGADYSTGVFPQRERPARLDALSVVNPSILGCFRILPLFGRRVAGLPFAKGSEDGQGKAHVPAEHAPPGEDARLPSADADACRPVDPRRETTQGPQPPQRLRLTETVRTAGIQRVFRDGRAGARQAGGTVCRSRLRGVRAGRRQEDRRRGAAEPSPAGPSGGDPRGRAAWDGRTRHRLGGSRGHPGRPNPGSDHRDDRTARARREAPMTSLRRRFLWRAGAPARLSSLGVIRVVPPHARPGGSAVSAVSPPPAPATLRRRSGPSEP